MGGDPTTRSVAFQHGLFDGDQQSDERVAERQREEGWHERGSKEVIDTKRQLGNGERVEAEAYIWIGDVGSAVVSRAIKVPGVWWVLFMRW